MLHTKVQGHWSSGSSQAKSSKSTSFQNEVDLVPLAFEDAVRKKRSGLRILDLRISSVKGTKWT